MSTKIKLAIAAAKYAYEAVTVAVSIYQHLKNNTSLLEQLPKWRSSAKNPPDARPPDQQDRTRHS